MIARDDLHHACYVGMATEAETEARIDAYRDEVLREAAAKIRASGGHWCECCQGSADLIDPDKEQP